MEKCLTIYTDGSCLGNPGPGGWAYLFLNTDQQKIFQKKAGFELSTTNNRMEMMALLKALEAIKKLPHSSLQKIKLYSDSNLIIQTLNQGWKRKANRDLWLAIDQARENLPIQYFWVKGHAEDTYNNLCDQMAQKEAKKALKMLQKNGAIPTPSFSENNNSKTKEIQQSLF